MIIHSKRYDYQVNIKNDFSFLKPLLESENSFIVIDLKVYNLYKKIHFEGIPANNLMIIEATESNKTLDTAMSICEKMTLIAAKRNAKLISIGGGIIQDITGFIASVLYRGISWTYVPTTLLAACDSCIGGKTSLNYHKYKNLLGTFYPPKTIHICSDFFDTLDDLDLLSGLGEIVKFYFMGGQNSLQEIENNIDYLIQKDKQVISKFVETSLLFKKPFIEEDEFDEGSRIKLNFAHTFGHAIETVTGYAIPHGTAVAIGIVLANRVSVKRGELSELTAKRCEKVLKKIIKTNVRLNQYSTDQYIDAMRKDKKQISQNLTAILMYGEGMNVKLVHNLLPVEIIDAFDYFDRIL